MNDPFVKIARSDLQELRTRLVKTAELTKRAEAAERECDVLRRVLDLVAAGSLDPAAALDKLASFVSEPDRLRLLETALSAGVADVVKIGAVVIDADPVESEVGTSEEKFGRRLRNIVDAY